MKNKFYSLLLVTILIFTVIASSINVAAIESDLPAGEYFYAQLSNDEKVIYNDIKNCMINDNFEQHKITGFTEIRYQINGISDQLEQILTTAEPSEYGNLILALIDDDEKFTHYFQNAFDAFDLDHSEYYWIDPLHSVASFSLDLSTKTSGSTVTYGLILGYNIKYAALSNDYLTEFALFKSKVASMTSSTKSTYEKVQDIHDYLCDNVLYDTTSARSMKSSGAIIDGKCVCQGYAYAFKIACEYFGIPCICVGGSGKTTRNQEDHMWNYVQMDDGKWYGVDATWDDQITKIYNDFFLVGSDTKDEYFGKSKFSESHIPSGLLTAGSSRCFVYPTLAKDKYDPDFLLGDVNDDEAVNETDISVLTKYIAGWTVTVDTEKSDMNHDGKIDGKDAILLAKKLKTK